MPTTTTTHNTTSTPKPAVDIDIADDADVEFAKGAARYLRQAGLSDDAITMSLVDELGIDLTNAREITLTL